MSRRWVNYHLRTADRAIPGARSALPSGLPEAVASLRAADAGSQWFFQRWEDGGVPVADVWFHSYDSVLTDTVNGLGGKGASGDSPPSQSFRTRPGASAGVFGGSPATEGLAVALASASSDLALAVLRDGALPEDTQRSLAVLHLHTLAELVPDAHRLAFLFLYWEARAAGLSPGERTRIARLADRHATEPAALPSVDVWRTERAEASWRDYLRAAHTLVPGQTEAASPMNYLLFRHALQTHARLGVTAGTDAFAARTVRAALRAAPALPVPELQSA